MCGGATATQDKLQSEEADFYAKQIESYDTSYANFSALSDTLKKQFEPILAKGPNQRGFDDTERNTLNTQATEGTAQGYAKARAALQEGQAARGGGTSNINITSGGDEQEQEQLAATAAATTSSEKLGITTADYAKGSADYQNAIAGEESLAAGWNPNSFASSANSAGKTASDQANTIAQQQNSVWTSVIGALGGVAGQAASAGIKQWG
jgi:hypothetical protein